MIFTDLKFLVFLLSLVSFANFMQCCYFQEIALKQLFLDSNLQFSLRLDNQLRQFWCNLLLTFFAELEF